MSISNAALVLIIVVALASYLIGSVNFAMLISRVCFKEDVRQKGSGNAGMTNILRTYGKKAAIATGAGDFLKAVLAAVIARLLFEYFGLYMINAGYISGLFVVLGHLYPIYFGFRGGKGVLATLGVIFAVNPIVFFIIAVIFVPIVFITKIVSIASILGAVAYPVITWLVDYLRGRPAFFDVMFSLVFMVVILFMHRGNIKRLLNGTENKFGSKK